MFPSPRSRKYRASMYLVSPALPAGPTWRIVVPDGTSDGSKYMSTNVEMWSADAFPLASTGKRSG